jgi:ferritin
MIKEKVQKAINEQIQAEFQSAYIYLGMSAYFEESNLDGFANWMKIQWEEEIQHGMYLYEHILRRGGHVELLSIDQPKLDIKSPVHAFEQALEHERYITGRINDLYELAQQEKDNPLQTLLHWFIDEQVEEEENTDKIRQQLEMVGDDRSGLFMLDKEMGERQAGQEEPANEGP